MWRVDCKGKETAVWNLIDQARIDNNSIINAGSIRWQSGLIGSKLKILWDKFGSTNTPVNCRQSDFPVPHSPSIKQE